MLVKASVAGAIVTNSLFMLGASFLLGGLRYHVQEFNRVAARFQAGLLFLASIGLLIPSAVAEHESLGKAGLNQELSLALSILLLLAYGLGLWFSLNTHRELFASTAEEHGWGCLFKLWLLMKGVVRAMTFLRAGRLVRT